MKKRTGPPPGSTRTPRGGGAAGGQGKKRKTAAPVASGQTSTFEEFAIPSEGRDRAQSLDELDLFMEDDVEIDTQWSRQPPLQRSYSAPQSGSGAWDGEEDDAGEGNYVEHQRRIEDNERRLLESARNSARLDQISSASHGNLDHSVDHLSRQREEEKKARINAAIPNMSSGYDDDEEDDDFS